MKAPTGVAGLVVFALALAAVPAPAVDQLPVGKAVPFPHEPPPLLPDLSTTAIGALVEANGGKLPLNGTELTESFEKLGPVVQLSFPFSAVALDSSLSQPRVILTMQLSPNFEVIPFTPFGGWGSRPSKTTGAPRIVAKPLPTREPAKQNLEGRLFLAANMEAGDPGETPRVKTVEFISWNSRRLKFDFGVIDQMGVGPRIQFLDGARCFSCHKNRGPIMGVGPWSNSIHNEMVQAASRGLFPRGEEAKVDGMRLLQSDAPAVEEAVRAGANMLRTREVVRTLPKTNLGKKTLQAMFTAFVSGGSLTELDSHIRRDMNRGELLKFIGDSVAIQKATASGFLADFSPAGSMGTVNGNKITWGGSSLSVTQYDGKRSAGQAGVPTEFLPSNPKAFLRPPLNVSNHPGDHLSAVKLARAMGITEGDRALFSKWFEDAVSSVGVNASFESVAKAVFTGRAFADVFEGAELPDRDEFKDRVNASLPQKVDRKTYASTAKIDRSSVEQEIDVIPTTACLRCHDVKQGNKPLAFNPIPPLAFDPFDTVGREAWAKLTERKQKAAVLTRFLKRLATDKDMPPEDSTEAQLFREKDPAAFDKLKVWLETELKKAQQ